MTITLLEFLEARLAEDEAAARAAAALGNEGCWTALDNREWFGPAHPERSIEPGIALTSEPASGAHIARHDPARVLAEVESKRRLIDQVLGYEAGIDGEFGCCHKADEIADGECPDTPVDEIEGLRIMAALYADHTDYREEWKPLATGE